MSALSLLSSLPKPSTLLNLVYMPTPVPSLRGKAVLITGAASGIGRATALAAAAEGAELVLTDVQSDALDQFVESLNDAGATVLYHRAGDLSDYEWVAAFARSADDGADTDRERAIRHALAAGPMLRFTVRQVQQ